MAYIDVSEWSALQTTEWLSGLDDCILPYVKFFINNDINGRRLLVLSSHDLTKLSVTKVGHQEIILEGVRLLQQLQYNLCSETLQTLALQLGCRARSLYNQLKHRTAPDDNGLAEPHSFTDDIRAKVSTETLSAVSEIMAAVKPLISWIDRYSSDELEDYIPVRKAILKQSLELASTAQRDRFVDRPNRVIKDKCLYLADICDWIVHESDDSLAIQTAVLEVVTVKKEVNEQLGLHLSTSYNGVHIVTGFGGQSPVDRCGKVEPHDQLVQVNYQTVLGWSQKNVTDMLYMCGHDTKRVVLTLKKSPRHSDFAAEVSVVPRFKIPNRRVITDSPTVIVTEEVDDVNQNQKRRQSLRRRASTSGSSPTDGQQCIKFEDLLNK